MRISKSLQRSVFLLACVGMIIPRQCLLAQQPAEVITDIALNSQGVFQGRVVDSQGTPLSNVGIKIANDRTTFVETNTDGDGVFSVASLRGGLYALNVGQMQHNVRVWAPNTAPPTAKEGVTVTVGAVQRGQGCTIDSCTGSCGGTCGACTGGALGFLMNPWVIGAAVAAAIAIPLALDDDDDDAS